MVGTRGKILALAVIVALIVLPSLVRAIKYSPGVKVGDYIKYGQITVTWTGNGTEPSYVTDERNLDWASINVTGVAGTVVTLNSTAHYINGTEIYQTISEDVNSTTYLGSTYLIAANLNSGDSLTPEAGSPTINQTVGKAYAGAGRDVNLINVTTVYQNQDVILATFYDQNTGVMTEMDIQTPDITGLGTPTGTFEISMVATDTNLWAPIGYSYIAAFCGVCAVLSVGFFYGLRRINRPKITR